MNAASLTWMGKLGPSSMFVKSVKMRVNKEDMSASSDLRGKDEVLIYARRTQTCARTEKIKATKTAITVLVESKMWRRISS